ncbi:unnamed protein product, partial [Rotaria magnacalcarata]
MKQQTFLHKKAAAEHLSTLRTLKEVRKKNETDTLNQRLILPLQHSAAQLAAVQQFKTKPTKRKLSTQMKSIAKQNPRQESVRGYRQSARLVFNKQDEKRSTENETMD